MTNKSPSKKTSTTRYYGSQGAYLDEHKDFLKNADVQKEVAFLVEALNLQKDHRVLDIACGQGRHVHALLEQGYQVDGVDFSFHLLSLARENVPQSNYTPTFYESDVTDLTELGQYDAAYWFFSDLAGIDLKKALGAIGQHIRTGGRLLLDTDSLFRIMSFLQSHPSSDFDFDTNTLELIDTKQALRVPYPAVPMWQTWAQKAGFEIEQTWGDYDQNPYSVSSPRLILLFRKTA